MPFYIGENKIVDRYIGDKLVVAAYKGEIKYFDAYSEITGPLPIIFKSRAAVALKNYLLHGTSEGAGVKTENLWGNDDFWDNGHKSESNPYLFCYAYNVSPGMYTVSTNVIDNVDTSIASTFVASATPNQAPSISSVNNGVFVNRPRTVTVRDNQALWIIIRVGKNPSESYLIWNKESFSNYWIMLTPSSTAPSTYIPHGYSIPLTVTSGAQSTITPVYIGDSKLGAEEYVDYQKQKVYKRTENLLKLDRAKSITFTIDNRYYVYGGVANAAVAQPNNIVSADINENYVEVHSKTGAGIGYIVEVKPNTTYTLSYDLDVSVSDDKSTAALNTISNDGVFGSFVAIYGGNNKCTITTMENSKYLYVTFRVVNVKAKYTNITLTEGSTPPETYIPYFQPVDPPVPLPEIPTYQGENTLSSTETLGEATIKGRIEKIILITPDIVQGSIDYSPYTIGQRGTRTSVTTRCSTQSCVTIPPKTQVRISADKDDVVFHGCWTDTNLTFQGHLASGFAKELVLENTELSDKYIVLNAIGRMLPTDADNSPTGAINPSYFTITFKIKEI